MEFGVAEILKLIGEGEMLHYRVDLTLSLILNRTSLISIDRTTTLTNLTEFYGLFGN